MIGPESLATALTSCGLNVVGGNSFITAAVSLRQKPDEGHVFPLILVVQEHPRFGEWIEQNLPPTQLALVGDMPDAPEGVIHFPTGGRLVDICQSIGVDATLDASLVVGADGSVTRSAHVDDVTPPQSNVTTEPSHPETNAIQHSSQDERTTVISRESGTPQSTSPAERHTPVSYDVHRPEYNPPTEPIPRVVNTHPPAQNPSATAPAQPLPPSVPVSAQYSETPQPGYPPTHHDPAYGSAPQAHHPAQTPPPPVYGQPPEQTGYASAPQHYPGQQPVPPMQPQAGYASAPAQAAYGSAPQIPAASAPPAGYASTSQHYPQQHQPAEPEPPRSTIVHHREDQASLLEASKVFSATGDPYSRSHGRKAELIIPYARKGGVGKTTMSISLAHRAASRGLRVTLIDGNRGQADLRVILRLANKNLPSVYDSAITGDPMKAIIPPDTINSFRAGTLEKLGFAFVSAPPTGELADPTVVTADVYRKVVTAAREISDIVIFDTQITESFDTTGIIDGFVIPELQAGAWGLGMSDLFINGISNLSEYNKRLITQYGITPDRLLLAINRIAADSQYDPNLMQNLLSQHGVFLGGIAFDAHVTDQMNRGHVPDENSVFDDILDAILYRVTGKEEFAPSGGGSQGKRRRLFSRR